MGYTSAGKQNKSRLTAVIALALCVVLSASMLFSRLMVYTPEDTRQYIPLTRSNGITHVTAVNAERSAAVLPNAKMLVAMPVLLTARPGFQASDENTVWEGETKVEIFRVSYDNENGDVTVRSAGGDKVLAPGTGNTYEFALENTGNVALDYTLSMEAYFSDTETPIPVNARVTDYEGNYLVGSAGEMVDVLELNKVNTNGVISAGYVAPYTLEWEWPFEEDDEYDTMLGNLAVEEDISLTIVIKTTAEYSADPEAPGGLPPKTGDTYNVALPAGLMVVSLAGILLLLLLRRKDEAHEKA